MTFRVRIGAVARESIDARFDELPEDAGPSLRHCHVLVPGFTPIVVIGVLVEAELVEIAGFEDDPDYWDTIENDPRD